MTSFFVLSKSFLAIFLEIHSTSLILLLELLSLLLLELFSVLLLEWFTSFLLLLSLSSKIVFDSKCLNYTNKQLVWQLFHQEIVIDTQNIINHHEITNSRIFLSLLNYVYTFITINFELKNCKISNSMTLKIKWCKIFILDNFSVREETSYSLNFRNLRN